MDMWQHGVRPPQCGKFGIMFSSAAVVDLYLYTNTIWPIADAVWQAVSYILVRYSTCVQKGQFGWEPECFFVTYAAIVDLESGRRA
jgi:hypothetical protein